MTYEDLSAFTKVDPYTNWEKTETRCTGTDVSRNENSYVYKDYEVDHFGDFEHLYTANFTGLSGDNPRASPWGTGNALGAIGHRAPYLDSFFYRSQASIRVYINDSEGGIDYDLIALDTPFYYTTKREGTTWTLKTYSDSERTVLVHTLEIVCAETLYRYLYCGSSCDTGHNMYIDLWSENFDLQEPLEPVDLSDTLGISDSISLAAICKRTIDDTQSLTDSVALTLKKHLSDTLSLSDSVSFLQKLFLDDTLSISDFPAICRKLSIGDELSISDQLIVATVFYLPDTLAISDSLTHKFIVPGGLTDLTQSPALIVTRCYAIADDVPAAEKLRIWARARDGKENIIYIDPA